MTETMLRRKFKERKGKNWLMKRYLIVIILFGFPFSGNNVFSEEVQVVFSEEVRAVPLSGLIEEALSNNPEVQIAYKEWEAARYRIDQERSFPDPTIKYTYFGESVETRVGPQEYKLGGSLKIPFPVKLGLKGSAQSKRAKARRERYEAVRREIIKDVKFQYYDIYWVEQAVKITEQEKGVVESVEKVAERRYETNRALQQDVIRTQIELSRLINRLLQLKQNRRTLMARMNDILARPQGTEIWVTENIELPEFVYGLSELREMAMGSQQELLAAKLDVERAKFERSLAFMDYIPDAAIGFDYISVGKGHTNMPNDGQDAWLGTVSINVPLWFDRLSSQLREKKALLEARVKDVKNIEDKILYEVEDLYFKILTYRDIITLYKTALVPQAEQALEATRTGYETGRVKFIDWLDSERVLLQTQLAYYKSIVDYMKSIAFLERIVGRDL